MASLTQITHEDLRIKLHQGSTKFYFRKVEGELRIALGTLEISRIPEGKHPKGGKTYGNATRYFDLEKGEWRSVSETQEIWVD